MTEQVTVAIVSKDMCVAVKDKSGLQIAGFLRNIYKYSLYKSINWYSTKYIMGIRNNLSFIFKLGTINYKIKSQFYCDKVIKRNGNNQDYKMYIPNN